MVSEDELDNENNGSTKVADDAMVVPPIENASSPEGNATSPDADAGTSASSAVRPSMATSVTGVASTLSFSNLLTTSSMYTMASELSDSAEIASFSTENLISALSMALPLISSSVVNSAAVFFFDSTAEVPISDCPSTACTFCDMTFSVTDSSEFSTFPTPAGIDHSELAIDKAAVLCSFNLAGEGTPYSVRCSRTVGSVGAW
uniref:Uncharacterized protein n=1 Tax=Parascaris univalens TaxID=6257 RepID=A0A915CGK2_PARUN